jgi:threonine/homoserine/homoserine lactone efflux protein
MRRTKVDQPQRRFDADMSTVLSIVTTEHYNVQTERAMTVSETVGRAGMFLTTVSMTLVALAFAAEITDFSAAFTVLGVVAFLTLLFLGVVTFERVLQASIDDVAAGQRINRLRRLYLELVPELGRYLRPPAGSDDASEVLRLEGKRPNRWQLILTIAGMVSVINSVIAGVMVGALVSLVADHLSISVIAGVAAFIGAVVVHQRVQMSWRTREPSPLPQMPAEDR